MVDAAPPSLIGPPPGPLRAAAGRLLAAGYALSGKRRYDEFRLERVLGMAIVVIPSVANPKLLRTGAFLASQIDRRTVKPDAAVLDLGTGSGICALAAARWARRVVAVDINPAAVRCAGANALLNGLEQRIDLRHGDLFEPVAGERFDLVLFNPPFLQGVPRDHRDAAWRSPDAAPRFAAGLDAHLASGGVALVLLSSFGDVCPQLEAELRARGFRLEPFARRRFINETLTIVRVTRP
ncbi:MAG TPA: HemK2/MTQ2 family protein methyltransferase [Gammaproteobacteria bacterium]